MRGRQRPSRDRTKPRTRRDLTYLRIWLAVQEIPRGRVATYGQIARVAGLPGRARLVGRALRLLPRNFPAPWHRVINAQGKISLRRPGGSHRLQQRLLNEEGVRFHKGKVDLDTFRWMA